MWIYPKFIWTKRWALGLEHVKNIRGFFFQSWNSKVNRIISICIQKIKKSLKIKVASLLEERITCYTLLNLKRFNQQSGAVDFGDSTFYTSLQSSHMFPLKRWPPFNSRYPLFIYVCCFRLSEPSRLHSLFLPALGSVCSFILTPAFSRFCVLNVRQVLCIFCLPASFAISGWVDVRTMVPQGVGVENRICSLRMQKRKESGRDGGMDEGRGEGLYLMWGPSKASRGIKADHGRPDAASPCQPQGIHPSACFWETPLSCCFFSPNFCFFT